MGQCCAGDVYSDIPSALSVGEQAVSQQQAILYSTATVLGLRVPYAWKCCTLYTVATANRIGGYAYIVYRTASQCPAGHESRILSVQRCVLSVPS